MAEKLLGIVAELGTEQLVGGDVLIGPQRRNNVHRVVLAFRRDRDIPPYRCDRLSPTLRQYQTINNSGNLPWQSSLTLHGSADRGAIPIGQTYLFRP